MLKIGNFSKLAQVSIRMLRHYDEMGLLKPSYTDPTSGYRYYTAEQLPRLYRILALQDLGFSLKQIVTLLEQSLTTKQIKGMLMQKQAELEDHIRSEQERLARANTHLELIDNFGDEADILVKDVSSQWVVSVRDTVMSYDTVGVLYERLFPYLAQMKVEGLVAVVWHDDSYQGEDIDAEVMVFLDKPIPNTTGINVYQLPQAQMATIIHHGSYRTLPKAYSKIARWLSASPYEIIGANRELYLHYTNPPQQDDESYVTEIQFPIKTIEKSK